LTHLYIIGGGRWARVVLTEAVKIQGGNLKIIIVSSKNHKFMKEWLRDFVSTTDVTVISYLPKTVHSRSFFYVLNETNERYDTLSRLLKFQSPVLVEKPLGLNYDDVNHMISLYESKQVPLLSSSVFKFLDSGSALKNLLEKYQLRSIVVNWFDPNNEYKFGEEKKYETVVSPYLDTLSHILSLLDGIIGDSNFKFIDFKNNLGEFNLILEMSESIRVEVHSSRISPSRVRLIDFLTSTGKVQYDFSGDETINVFNGTVLISNQMYVKTSSIQKMLRTFLSVVNHESVDSRFSHTSNLKALQISHEIDKFIAI
jgi:predicted dehydrogenase